MHRARNTGLEVVLRHRGGDQQVDLAGCHAGSFKSTCTGEGSSFVEGGLGRPPATGGDAGDALEKSWAHTAAFVGLGQLFVDPGRGDPLRSFDM